MVLETYRGVARPGIGGLDVACREESFDTESYRGEYSMEGEVA